MSTANCETMQHFPNHCDTANDHGWETGSVIFFLDYVTYFSLMFLMIVAITIIYVFITRHVVKSSKTITSIANFERNYRILLRNISQMVFHESVALLLYFIAAICNNINGIDVTLILSAIL